MRLSKEALARRIAEHLNTCAAPPSDEVLDADMSAGLQFPYLELVDMAGDLWEVLLGDFAAHFPPEARATVIAGHASAYAMGVADAAIAMRAQAEAPA